MELVFREITELEYDNLNYRVPFTNKLTNRFFGVISVYNCNYKFAWQSEVSKPKIDKIHNKIYSIGVDLNFVIIDFNLDKVTLSLALNYFFYSVKIYKENLYVITELQILKISSVNLQLIKSYDLPDFFEEIFFSDDEIRVSCVGNDLIVLN